jgi:predicted TIM-barrel enzyme
MQDLSTLLLSLTTLAPAARTNFDIYFHGGEDALITDNSYDYKFYKNDPSCHTV